MRILVLGAAGMLGHKVFQTLAARFPDTTGAMLGRLSDAPYRNVDGLRCGRMVEGLDVGAFPALRGVVQELRPDVIVNCVGIVKQRQAAQDGVSCITINALLPHQLAQLCETNQARLIHFSTDCVFSGQRGHYREDDVSDAKDLYGRSKFLGEVSSGRSLTLRTSIIGRELTHFQSLLEWFLANPDGSPPVRGFRRAVYSGVTTNHLAKLVGDIIAEHTNLSGLYQVASEPITKFDLLSLVRDAYGRTIDIVPDDSFSCDRSLRGDKLRSAIGYRAPSWEALVTELASDPTPYARWR